MTDPTQTAAATPEQTRRAWDRIATRYDAHVTPTGDWTLPREALDSVGLRPGERFLDVASGTGALALPAARAGAGVLAVDLSPEMIGLLRERARSEGLDDVEARVMDGHALDLDDDAFDVVGSQFGVMLFEDLPRGLREMVRVTKPGGRVLVVAYGPPPEVEFLGTFLEAVHAVVPGLEVPPMDPPPLPFQVANPDDLRQALADAGLGDVRVEPGVERLEVRSGAELWDWVVNSNPLPAGLVADLSEAEKAAVQEHLDGIVRERAGDDEAAVLESLVHIGTGRK